MNVLPNVRSDLERTSFVILDELCPVVRRKGTIPKWRLLGKIFKPWGWFGLIGFFLLNIISWYCLQKCSGQPTVSLHRTFFETYQMFITMQLNRQINETFERFFISTLQWGLLILIPGLFIGTLVSIFTIPISYPQLNTYKEILDAGLLIPFGDPKVGKTIYSADSINKEDRELNQRVIKYISDDPIQHRVPILLPYQNEGVAVVMPRYQTYVSGIATLFNPYFGKLHMSTQCYKSAYHAYYLKRFGVFNSRIKIGGLLMFEAGIINFWYGLLKSKTQAESIAEYYRIRPSDTAGYGTFHPFELAHFLIALIILIVGWFLGFICVLIEIKYAKTKQL